MTSMELLALFSGLIGYTSLIFGGVAWMIRNQTQKITAEMKPIKEALTNHVTDTDKKIDKLDQDIKDGFANLTKRIDHQTDRFDKLYELLLKDKAQK